MASLRKRSSKWQVQVRRDGFKNLSKTFTYKEDAIRWSREIERQIDLGELRLEADTPALQKLSDILKRYEQEVSSKKRSQETEHFYIRKILSHPIADIAIKNLTPSSICKFRDDRLNEVSGQTVRNEMVLLQHALKISKSEWGTPIRSDVLEGIIKPSPAKPRTRRLNVEELEALSKAIRTCRNKHILNVFLFAIFTGMRRGEILSLTWDHVDFEIRTAHLPITKNGEARTVPLSPQSINILQGMQKGSKRELVFPVSKNALRMAWERAKRRAQIADLRFHDLRHEAISRFFEMGLSVPEVALISGHKDVRMLFRYTHLRPIALAEKLQRIADLSKPQEAE